MGGLSVARVELPFISDSDPYSLAASNSTNSAPLFEISSTFGEFGGQFAPEALVPNLVALEAAFLAALKDPSFKKEFESYYHWVM